MKFFRNALGHYFCNLFPVIFFISAVFLNFNLVKVSAEGSSVGVSIGVGDTVLILEGKTTPDSVVTFKENEAVIGTTTSDANGDFSKTFNPISAGIHDIEIYSTDGNGKLTSTITQSVNAVEFTTVTVSNIIIPATINVDPSILDQGGLIHVYGYAVPNSTVSIFFITSGISTSTTSTSVGSWEIYFDTTSLNTGPNYVYSKVLVSGGYQSEISETLSFIVNEVESETEEDEDDEEEEDEDEDEEESGGGTGLLDTLLRKLEKLTGLIPGQPSVGKCSLPKFIVLFDYDKNCLFIFNEFVDAAKSFVKLWIDKDEPRCDINYDTRCNLTDFSIMLYYINR